jgi:hypothetical protein
VRHALPVMQRENRACLAKDCAIIFRECICCSNACIAVVLQHRRKKLQVQYTERAWITSFAGHFVITTC